MPRQGSRGPRSCHAWRAELRALPGRGGARAGRVSCSSGPLFIPVVSRRVSRLAPPVSRPWPSRRPGCRPGFSPGGVFAMALLPRWCPGSCPNRVYQLVSRPEPGRSRSRSPSLQTCCTETAFLPDSSARCVAARAMVRGCASVIPSSIAITTPSFPPLPKPPCHQKGGCASGSDHL